jgi:phage tail protein X
MADIDTYTTQQGDMVDLIAYRLRGTSTGITEAIFTLNPGLAKHGLILPAGLVLKLPPPPAKKTVREVKRIWS